MLPPVVAGVSHLYRSHHVERRGTGASLGVPKRPVRVPERTTALSTAEVYGHFERAERRREAEQMAGVFGV